MHRGLSFSPRYKILNYLTGFLMIVGGVCMAVIPNLTIQEHRLSFILPIVGFFYIIGFLRKKVSIEQGAIISVTTFSKKQLDLAEIEGIKINEKVIILTSKSPHKNDLYIHDYKQLKDSNLLVDFLNNAFQDIDRFKFHQGVANHVYDLNYGFTPEQRQINIKKYNKIALFINAAGLVFALTIFIPLAIFKAIAVALPPLCIFLVFITNKRFKLSSKYGPVAYPVLGTAYIIPIFTIFFKSFLSYNLYSLDNLWIPSLAFGGMMIIFYNFVNKDELPDKSKDFNIALILFFLLYSFSSIRLINCEFDQSAGQVYSPRVIKREISERLTEHNKKRVYHLVLSSWGPRQESKDIEISRERYDRTHVGDAVKIVVKPGLLNIPWFVVDK